jgi:hypothetical protein
LLSSAQPGVSYDVAPNIEPAALAFIATRTCGPVPAQNVFKPTTPTIAWGAGFYPPTHVADIPEDPIGNLPMRGSEPLFRWASRKAELLVTRSGCRAMDMQVTFAVDTSQPASIRASWPGGVVTARGGAHTLPILVLQISRTVKSPIHIEIETDAPPFPEQRLTIRHEGEEPQDRRMLVVEPAVADQLSLPLDQRLNPTGGLL